MTPFLTYRNETDGGLNYKDKPADNFLKEMMKLKLTGGDMKYSVPLVFNDDLTLIQNEAESYQFMPNFLKQILNAKNDLE